ncbi:cuticular protein glycine-rich 19 [Aphomia sociella]
MNTFGVCFLIYAGLVLAAALPLENVQQPVVENGESLEPAESHWHGGYGRGYGGGYGGGFGGGGIGFVKIGGFGGYGGYGRGFGGGYGGGYGGYGGGWRGGFIGGGYGYGGGYRRGYWG